MIVLRDYQQEVYDKIINSKSVRNCVQAPTGAGKTIIFSHLANEYKGNVLILLNRTELIGQTSKNITRPISLITAKTKVVGKGQVFLGMVESVNNRIKKGLFNLDNIDLIIVDEIQNLQFVKVFENYKKRLIGFTATPVILKKETFYKCKYCESAGEIQSMCCGKETKKHNTTISLKRWYGELITSTTVAQLIEKDKLTQVHNFQCQNDNLKRLKTDNSGEYTTKSLDDTFNNLAGLENLVENYKKLCLNQKTMVFNSNISSNNEAVKKFKELGFNVRGFDSKSKEKRKDIVEWFKKTPDAVLMSVGVFTTGFDVDDVQNIVLNMATKSLSLYHQIVGRGGRITEKIFKPYFKLIDLGGNIKEHGSWDDDIDWVNIYDKEVVKQTKINDLEDYIVCHECEAMITEYDCEFCGAEAPPKKEQTKKVVIATEIKKLPPPKPEHILRYANSCNLDVNKAKIFTANYIVDMFIFSRTPKVKAMENREYLRRKIKEMITPIYFALHGSELLGNRRRTIYDFESKVQKSINKYYENRS